MGAVMVEHEHADSSHLEPQEGLSVWRWLLGTILGPEERLRRNVLLNAARTSDPQTDYSALSYEEIKRVLLSRVAPDARSDNERLLAEFVRRGVLAQKLCAWWMTFWMIVLPVVILAVTLGPYAVGWSLGDWLIGGPILGIGYIFLALLGVLAANLCRRPFEHLLCRIVGLQEVKGRPGGAGNPPGGEGA